MSPVAHSQCAFTLHCLIHYIYFNVVLPFRVYKYKHIQLKMSRRVWLLVEWLGQKHENVLPSYGVADTVINRENEVRPGQIIYIQPNKNGSIPRKAQILKISGNNFYFRISYIYLLVPTSFVSNFNGKHKYF